MCTCLPGEKFLRLIGHCQYLILNLKYQNLSSISKCSEIVPQNAKKQMLIIKILCSVYNLVAAMLQKLSHYPPCLKINNIAISGSTDFSFPIPITDRPDTISDLSRLNVDLFSSLVNNYRAVYKTPSSLAISTHRLHFLAYLLQRCEITLQKLTVHIHQLM